MEILIIIALVLLNGIFSMAEMSLVSSRKFKLESAQNKGNKGAKTALELAENPTRFLSTVQIGITLIGILLGIYSGENLTGDVERFLQQWAWMAPYAHSVAVGGVVMFITYLSILLGELLPKRIGLTFPEPIAIVLAQPMKLLSGVTAPFVWLLTSSNDILLRLLGIKNNLDSKITEEEIKSIIRDSADGGEIQGIEQNIVERVFEMGDKKVISLMTHRSELIYFDLNDDVSAIRQKISKEKHSVYPVCKDDDLDDIVGVALLKDLVEPMLDNHFHLDQLIRKPVYTTENTLAYKLLEVFKHEKMHNALVVDEFGSIRGLVTMDDVLDALIGDVAEINQSEYQVVQRDPNSWFIDGQYPVSEFLKQFEIDLEDEEIDDEFVTVGGLFIALFRTLPNVGDKVTIDRFELEIVDKDGQRIDKILLTQLHE